MSTSENGGREAHCEMPSGNSDDQPSAEKVLNADNVR